MIKLSGSNIHEMKYEDRYTVLEIPYPHIIKEKFVKVFCESLWGSHHKCLVVEYSDEIMKKHPRIKQKKYSIFNQQENPDQNDIYAKLLKYIEEDLE